MINVQLDLCTYCKKPTLHLRQKSVQTSAGCVARWTTNSRVPHGPQVAAPPLLPSTMSIKQSTVIASTVLAFSRSASTAEDNLLVRVLAAQAWIRGGPTLRRSLMGFPRGTLGSARSHHDSATPVLVKLPVLRLYRFDPFSGILEYDVMSRPCSGPLNNLRSLPASA